MLFPVFLFLYILGAVGGSTLDWDTCCSHRVSLARSVKQAASAVSPVLDATLHDNLNKLSSSLSLSMDQVGLMLGATLAIETANQAEYPHTAWSLYSLSRYFTETALKNDRPHTSMISLILTGFETDFQKHFGSSSLGYRLLMSVVIVIHNPTIPASIRQLALDKFTSFLSVPVGCNVQPFMDILDQLLPSLEKPDFESIESALQTVDCALPVTM